MREDSDNSIIDDCFKHILASFQHSLSRLRAARERSEPIPSSSTKENKINGKGRLAQFQDEIERMEADLEKYKAKDDAYKNRLEAKNSLEAYCYSLKRFIDSDEVKSQIPGDGHGGSPYRPSFLMNCK